MDSEGEDGAVSGQMDAPSLVRLVAPPALEDDGPSQEATSSSSVRRCVCVLQGALGGGAAPLSNPVLSQPARPCPLQIEARVAGLKEAGNRQLMQCQVGTAGWRGGATTTTSARAAPAAATRQLLLPTSTCWPARVGARTQCAAHARTHANARSSWARSSATRKRCSCSL